MIITRKKKIPGHWLFYVQLPLVLSIYGNFVINAPFLFMMKRFIDNPAAIMGLISIEFYVTWLGGPFISWLSDRIWTRFGRRKFFFVIADAGKGFILLFMPFAPNLWVLIVLRWIYGAVGDFGSMTQALIYETVPSKQRGKASGIFSSCMQFGNLVFFFLLIGRFDDLYFMGPFRFLTEINGGAIMFWLAAILLMGIAMFEGLGFKEIKPPNLRLLRDERNPNESLVKHFTKSFLKDVLAKDFLPLYLFMFVNVMFGVGLGVFQPLLFTEQWGYSLQDLGNTIAIGVATTVTFSLISGWFADRYGKMKTFLIATILSFVVNIFYTAYVFFQPDYRPSLTEIVIIGNVAAAIGMVKGVVTFPLMMEYVKRSRMGAANAGMGLFGSLIRNLITLFVGVWLLGWSIWFFPQAGYHVETTFQEEWDQNRVEDVLREHEISLENLVIRPVHQYGIDGETSMRWWIHLNDDLSQELLKERKNLTNERSPLKVKLDSPMLDDLKRSEIEGKLARIDTRLEDIRKTLEQGADDLRAHVLPALQDHLYSKGDQIHEATFDENRLRVSLQTIESFDPELQPDLERMLEGPQFARIENTTESSGKWRADLEVDLPYSYVLTLTAGIDPRFVDIFNSLTTENVEGEMAFSFTNGIMGILRSELGTAPDDFDLTQSSYNQTEKDRQLRFHLTAKTPIDTEILSGMLTEEKGITNCQVTPNDDQSFLMTLHLEPFPAVESKEALRRLARKRDLLPGLERALGDDSQKQALVAEIVLRLTDTLNAKPFYVTVPEHTPSSNFADREYEYFFSSQSLMIATDVIGFGIIYFLILMEKRGVVHRVGVEEDENR
jgi:MFS family permease